MKPYPTRDGLIISPYELGFTQPTEQDHQLHRVNLHHGYWPWNAMDDQVKRVFASLVDNTFQMIPSEHNMGNNNLHHRFGPPRLPRKVLMIDQIEEYLDVHGIINCVKHKKTKESYTVTAEQWERIKNGNN